MLAAGAALALQAALRLPQPLPPSCARTRALPTPQCRHPQRLATVEAHDLAAPASGLAVPAAAHELAEAVSGDVSAVSLAGGHDLLHGSDASARALGALALAWLEKRL